MASESETVMAVCAEWRDCIESADPSVWNDERIAGLVKTTKAQQLAYLARIEAAAKRDAAIHAMTREANERLREHLEIALEDNKRPVGNAAALREALEKVRFYLPYFLQYMRLHWEDAEAGGYYERILEVVNTALSAPARNCDRFADAESARQAWLDDAENWDEFGSPKLELHEWLFAPAAERKGEGDAM